MIRPRWLAAVLLLFVAGSAAAEEEAPSSCIVFADDVASLGTQYANMYFDWAQHHMNRHNWIAKQRGKAGRDLDFDILDIDQQLDYMLAFCTEQPDKEFVDAVMSLYQEFPVAE
ncbi:MAG: hypothetical protein QF926_14660 [Alphaproteobacteria bacterium]|jgi:hypothetical protein|nr:hypothetical protein [Alphaproteobacteria bacterium]MDP6517844.1 hypothetical protein [Alphaproteobacteria bacterium]